MLISPVPSLFDAFSDLTGGWGLYVSLYRNGGFVLVFIGLVSDLLMMGTGVVVIW